MLLYIYINISNGIVGVIDKSKDGISITKSYNNALIKMDKYWWLSW